MEQQDPKPENPTPENTSNNPQEQLPEGAAAENKEPDSIPASDAPEEEGIPLVEEPAERVEVAAHGQ